MSSENKEYCELIDVARNSIQAHLKDEMVKLPKAKPPLDQKMGVFVTLYSPGKELRGCIGHLSAMHENLVAEVADVAVSSAMRDTRFSPLSLEELEKIDIEISLLFPEELVDDRSTLDPKKFGVIVSSGYRRGVLLPDIDGVDTVDYQLSIALQKAGISPSEKFKIHRFEVRKIKQNV